ncbi:MAG: hypothetical protein AB7N70_38835, partial [Dehalococcoidia bacterium]
MPARVLCVNSGSSSLKVALYDEETRIGSAAVETIPCREGRVTVRGANGGVLRDEAGAFPDASAALLVGSPCPGSPAPTPSA